MVLTNVYGAALTIRATLDALKETKGHLLLTGSVAGPPRARRLALLGDQVGGHRHGRVAAQELNGTGVRVTVIEPGMVDTPFFDNAAPIEPLQADDIASAVMFAVAAAAARGRQRDPDPPDGAADLELDDDLDVVGAALERVLPVGRAGRAG